METAAAALDTTVLTILGSAFGVMFATLTTLMVGSMRVQHRDSIQARKDNSDLIEQARIENRDLIEQARIENRDLIEQATGKLSADLSEHRRIAEKNHDEVKQALGKITESLGDARERLARIEGHLGLGRRPPHDEAGEGRPNAA